VRAGDRALGEGDALCSGESRGDLRTCGAALVFGEVEGPRLKVSAFLGWLRLEGSGSGCLGKVKEAVDPVWSCLAPAARLSLLGPVRRRKNWTSVPCWPSLARDSRGRSVASSCLSESRSRWIRT